MPRGVVPHPIHPRDVALVLDSPGVQQRPPRLAPRRGPRSAAQDGVVIPAAAAPNREPQVIADEQQKPETPVSDHHAVAAGRVVPGFAAGREQMAFVIAGAPAVGRREIHPVEEAASFGDSDAARDGLAVLRGPAAQGRDDLPAGGFGDRGGIEREARGEQLGQHHHVGIGTGHQRLQPGEVPRRLFPRDVGLTESDTQLHRNQSLWTEMNEARSRWWKSVTRQGTKSDAAQLHKSTNCWGLRSMSGNHELCTCTMMRCPARNV